MRILKCEITIGAFTFDFVTDIEIVSSWDLLTDTATITLPKKLRYRGADGKIKKNLVRGTNAAFKRGNAVTINCGYYPNSDFGEFTIYHTVFEGYVTEISPKRPITIQCEDSAFLLKRMRIEKYSTGDSPQDLEETLRDITALGNSNPNVRDFIYLIKAESMELGEIVVENDTVAGFLDILKRKYGLRSYMRHLEGDNYPTLFCGFARVTQNNTQNNFKVPNDHGHFRFGRDIINDNNLTYRNSTDVAISLTAISIDSKNRRVSVTAGAPWGSARNLYYYHKLNTDDTPEAEPLPAVLKELQKVAESAVAEFKFDGYRGSFTTFGIPRVTHGDSAIIENGDITDTSGEYLLEKVVTRFGQGGYRQEIFLSARINEVERV